MYRVHRNALQSGKKKASINIDILGGTVSGTIGNLHWDKRDPFLGQTGTCPRDKLAGGIPQ